VKGQVSSTWIPRAFAVLYTISRSGIKSPPPSVVLGSAYPLYEHVFLPVAAFHSLDHLTTD